MNIRQLEEIWQKQWCFSLQQLQLYEPDFLRSNLIRWNKSWYIKRITKWWYCIHSQQINEYDLYFYANTIYLPSYVSMESALRYYDLIPEGVFMSTSCTTKKTQTLQWDLGKFYYYNIKKSLFWGYSLIKNQNQKSFLIASVEKTICDFFYLKKHITIQDIPELRIDKYHLWELTNPEKLLSCAKLFKNKRILTIIKSFISYLQENNA